MTLVTLQSDSWLFGMFSTTYARGVWLWRNLP